MKANILQERGCLWENILISMVRDVYDKDDDDDDDDTDCLP